MAERQMPETTTSSTQKESFPIPEPEKKTSNDILTTKKRRTKTETKLLDVLPFVSPDADQALDRAWEEVIKPKCQEILLDTLHSIVDTVFDGRGRGRTNYRGSYRESRSYDRPSWRDDSRRSRRNDRDYSSKSRRKRRDKDEIFDEEYSELKFTKSQAHADSVLDIMQHHIDKYDYCSINELWDIYEDVTESNVTNNVRNRDDDEWGWYSTRSARIRAVRDGWILELPKYEAIDERDLRR